MDPGRLPAYRSSYLLRFHPYPRVKPSTHERVVASTWADEKYCDPLPMNVLLPNNEAPFKLHQAIYTSGTDADGEIQLRHRRLSMSSLVVDLALMFTKKA